MTQATMGSLAEPETLADASLTEPPAVDAAASVVDMGDTIGADSHNLPTTLAKIGGYVTGSGGVLWSEAMFNRFTKSGHVRINQDPTSDPMLGGVLDVEPRAWTNTGAAAALRKRKDVGRYDNAYTSLANVSALETACRTQGLLPGQVGLWLANWNLSRDQAVAVLLAGHPYFRLVAVQWASPSSNPGTILPGTSLTLAQANADLSVALDSWYPPATTPPPPPPPTIKGLVVMENLSSHAVQSLDGGKSWH
jgi:opacity protein-like surface antigen